MRRLCSFYNKNFATSVATALRHSSTEKKGLFSEKEEAHHHQHHKGVESAHAITDVDGPRKASGPPPPTTSPYASSGGSILRSFTTLPDVDELLQRRARAIARAITLVESSNPEHATLIGDLLRSVRTRTTEITRKRREDGRLAKPPDLKDKSVPMDANGVPQASLFAKHLEWNRRQEVSAMRIAVSGSPGAGKSCFIEALGTLLADTYGLRVGVNAVDPSSVVTGGSILGDKTRMEKLSMSPNAYVRPSPSRGHLGGVTAKSWEALEILEAADFDVILVETVGVGQSEVAARNIVDLFLLLVPPASGDELQGIKKGIVEVADAIIVTKDDGDRKQLAEETKAAYTHAVMFQRNAHNVGGTVNAPKPHRTGIALDEDQMSDTLKPVIKVSAEEDEASIRKAWYRIERMWLHRRDGGQLSALRKRQTMGHFNEYFNYELVQRARALLGDAFLEQLEDEVVMKRLSPREAGDKALARVLRSSSSASEHHHDNNTN